ncbi:MAG: hypothetical protein ACLTKQ_09145 [Acutalibacteraceae bacterium]
MKKAAKKAEQKIQSATGKMKEAVGIAPRRRKGRPWPTRPRSRQKETTVPPATGAIPAHKPCRNGGASQRQRAQHHRRLTIPSTNGTTKPGSTTTTTTTQPTTHPENTALPKPEYNKYEYTLDGDYAKVTKYTGNAKVVVLPAAIDGHQVKYYCTRQTLQIRI